MTRPAIGLAALDMVGTTGWPEEDVPVHGGLAVIPATSGARRGGRTR